MVRELSDEDFELFKLDISELMSILKKKQITRKKYNFITKTKNDVYSRLLLEAEKRLKERYSVVNKIYNKLINISPYIFDMLNFGMLGVENKEALINGNIKALFSTMLLSEEYSIPKGQEINSIKNDNCYGLEKERISSAKLINKIIAILKEMNLMDKEQSFLNDDFDEKILWQEFPFLEKINMA